MSAPDEFAKATRRESILRLAIFGAFIAVTLLWLIVGLFEVPRIPENFTHSDSASPGGHKAFVDLLRKSGRTVRQDATRLTVPPFDARIGETRMLLEPRDEYMDEYETELEGFLKEAQTTHSSVVVVLPKRAYCAGDIGEDGKLILHEEIYGLHVGERLLRMAGLHHWFSLEYDARSSVPITGEGQQTSRRASCTLDEPVQVLKPTQRLRDLPSRVEVIARTDRGDAVAVRFKPDEHETRGGLVVVSDPDMFSNGWLGESGIADMAMLMLDAAPPSGEIVIDEMLHGFAYDTSLEYLAATRPGLWVSLSAFLLLGLFAWRQSTVLRPVAAEQQDRAARRYAIEGLGRMLERTGSHNEAARRIVKRSTLVLGEGAVTVQEAGMARPGAPATEPQRIPLVGATSADQLVNIARRVAEQKRAGESGGAEVWSG